MTSNSVSASKTLVLNPVSGSGDHREDVRRRAELNGYEMVETESEGDAVDLARTAAEDGATLVAAAGGDGTLTKVIRGVAAADALDHVTVGVIPVGTGNNFAGNIGVTDIDTAFDVLENGSRRWIDLGVADDTLFLNSCICGLTADASGETTPELKNKFGVVAYALNTFQTVKEFDGLNISVDAWQADSRDPVWEGDALMVLIGNGRRFSVRGNTQANMEDGRFDVTIVEQAPATGLMGEALAERLLGSDSEKTQRFRASSLELSGLEREPISFSLDGEMLERDSLSLDVQSRTLSMAVSDEYDPDPDHE
jgi:YegS/Rv2252/BmrU family lipid kinase